MDEIVIDDKKYLSSKQAAKVTGYAKDYIGQMCREGRVPARLVGRSWYVLESALKDHRFGGEKEKTTPETNHEVYSRYQADELEIVEASAAEEEEVVETKAAPQTHSIQEAWEAWFDRVANTAESAPAEEKVTEEEIITAEEEEGAEGEPAAESETVAIRTLKIHREEAAEVVEPTKSTAPPAAHPVRVSKKKFKLLRALSIIIAALSVGVAAVNTGYFDSYIISLERDSFISGITVYKK